MLVLQGRASSSESGLERFVTDRFDPIEEKLRADWTSADTPSPSSSFARASDVLRQYKDLAMQTLRVLSSAGPSAGAECDAMVRRYESAKTAVFDLIGGGALVDSSSESSEMYGVSQSPESPESPESSEMYGGSGFSTYQQVGGIRGRRRGGNNRGRGNRRNDNDRNRNDSDDRGSKRDRGGKKNGKKNNGGKNGVKSVDDDVIRAMKPDCARRSDGKPEQRMKDLQALSQWYAGFKRSLEESVKKYVDESSDQNKDALDCMPLSVRERVRDIKNFMEDLENYYMARLNDLYSDAYMTHMKITMTNDIFSDTDGVIFSDLRLQEAQLVQRFEAKKLLFNYMNIWHRMIDPNFEKMAMTARQGLRGAEPSAIFRQVFFNVDKRQFWFLWTAKAPELKNTLATVVIMKVNKNDKDGATIMDVGSSMSFLEAQQSLRTDKDRLVRLSAASTHALDFVRNNIA